jgi:polyphosphate glucokinase
MRKATGAGRRNYQPGAEPGRKAIRTLAVDIGGTGIKAITLDEKGTPLTGRSRIATPRPATPKAVAEAISRLAREQGSFDRVSVGFPGVVKGGVVYTAPNLGKGWNNYQLEATLARKLGRPVRLANDADVQGLGCIRGKGLELVITLGTGFGSVLFVDGHRIHMELGHHPFRKGRTYEDELGIAALEKNGRKKWNKRLREAIEDLRNTFNFDRLYIGGGNAKSIAFRLPEDVQAVSNLEGLLGGIALWRERRGSPPA